jgi:hypothetical protein
MNKHNSHHAVPNLVQSVPGAADGDPDIDTMPFLAWSAQMWYVRVCVCLSVCLSLSLSLCTCVRVCVCVIHI